MKRPTLNSLIAVLYALSLLCFSVAGKAQEGLPDGFPVTDDLSLYLDAEALELDDGHVVRWIDRSGNANDAWDTTPPDPVMPMLLEGVTPSGQDAVRFDGVGGYAEIASNPDDFDGRAKTTMVVFRADVLEGGLTAGRISSTAYEIIDDWEPADNQPSGRTNTNVLWAHQDSNLRVQNRNPDGGSVAVSTASGSLSAGEFVVGTNLWRENGDTVAALRNAANERFQNHAIGAFAFPEGHIHTRIGAGSRHGDTGLDLFFGGEVAAFVVFNRELPQSELEAMEEYLHGIYLGDGPGEGGPGEPPVTDGLVAHLNAGNLETNGETVTRLVDISGRDNHAPTYVEGAVAPTMPTLLADATPSGMAAASFDGRGAYMEIASNPESFDGPDKTILTVFRSHTLGLPGRFITSGYAEGENFPYYLTEAMFATTIGGGTLRVTLRHDDGNLNFSSPDGSVTTGEFYVGGTQISSDGNALSIIRNSDNERFVNQETGIFSNPESHLFTRLGTGGPSGVVEEVQPDSFFTGELAAVLIYNQALGTEDLEAVEEYLHQVYLGDGPDGGDPGQPPVTEGLVLHLNAANIDTDNGVINRMVDVSGNHNDAESFLFTEPRPSPTFVENATPTGRGALRFDGDLQYLEIAGNPDAFDGREKTTIAVFNPHVFGLRRMIDMHYGTIDVDNPDAPARNLMNSMFTTTGGALRIQNREAAGGTVLVSSPNDAVELDKFHIGINHWLDSGDMFAIVRNAENDRFVGETSGADANPGGNTRVRIGAEAGSEPDRFFSGELAALIVFNRALSDEELEQVEGFLYERYLLAADILESFEDWIAQFDLSEADQAPEANPSGDGVTNLEKFAFGMDPLVASRAGLPEFSVVTDDGEEFLALTINKNPEAQGIAYAVEASEDLIEWGAAEADVVVLEETDQVLRVRLANPLGPAGKGFLRAKVTLEDGG